jgi:G3E family GTPase
VRRELLQQFIGTLVDLRGADLLRVKGIVPLEGEGQVMVQGVRHVFDRLRPVEGGEPALVFITNGIDQGEVEALWRALRGLQSGVRTI